MLRMGRANILFRVEEPPNPDANEEEVEIVHKHTYPMIDKEKYNLNSAVIGRNDSITMSCFSRPLTQTHKATYNFKPIESVAERI